MTLETVFQGSTDGGVFTSTQLPLADPTDSTRAASFLGGDGSEGLAVYRITGHLYTVTFDSVLGSLPSLTGISGDLSGTDAEVTVFSPRFGITMPFAT